MTSPRLDRVVGDVVAGSPAVPPLLQLILDRSPGLLDGRQGDLRRAVLEVAVAGLVAADPGAATYRAVSYDRASDTVTVAGCAYPMHGRGRVLVVGAGKATYAIAAALEEILGDRLVLGVVAVRDPDVAPLLRVETVCANHPLPSERSVSAARQILACAATADADDLVVMCFTGGSSALCSLPPPGVSESDKHELHRLLLSSGLAITEINAVRKQVSSVKGGRVALAAAPARVVNLTVSDVAGSPLDAITDPSVQDTSDASRAREVLRSCGLWETVPQSVREHLQQNIVTPVLTATPQTVILADGRGVTAAMQLAAAERGFGVVVAGSEVVGNADDVGDDLARRVLAEAAEGRPPVMLVGCGGEAVVTVASAAEFGRGGPNQHAALRAAQVLAGRRAAALFVDTDGSDGGTELAGGLVDGDTEERARQQGVILGEVLRLQRSSAGCKQLGSAIRTGHTGTNVNDLFVLVAESGVAT